MSKPEGSWILTICITGDCECWQKAATRAWPCRPQCTESPPPFMVYLIFFSYFAYGIGPLPISSPEFCTVTKKKLLKLKKKNQNSVMSKIFCPKSRWYYMSCITAHILKASTLFETYPLKACSKYILFIMTIFIIIVTSLHPSSLVYIYHPAQEFVIRDKISLTLTETYQTI